MLFLDTRKDERRIDKDKNMLYVGVENRRASWIA